MRLERDDTGGILLTANPVSGGDKIRGFSFVQISFGCRCLLFQRQGPQIQAALGLARGVYDVSWDVSEGALGLCVMDGFGAVVRISPKKSGLLQNAWGWISGIYWISAQKMTP